MKAFSRIALLSLLGALGACQSSTAPSSPDASNPAQDRFFRYEHDRWSPGDKMTAYIRDVCFDFCDCFTADVGWGKTANGAYHAHPFHYFLANWFLFNVHLTKYCELGFGNWSGLKVGMLGRGIGFWREERYEGGFSLLLVQNYTVNTVRVPTRGNSQLATRHLDAHGFNIDLDNHNHWTDFGASFYFFILPGFDLNFSPYEAVDFIYGLLNNYPNPVEMTGTPMPWDMGIDIADDDTRPSVYDNKTGRARHSDYSVWPTIWPTTFGHNEEMEGDEWNHTHTLGTHTGSVGGAYGGDKSRR